jgi:hypothetical protein
MTGLDAPLKVNSRVDSHEQINIDVGTMIRIDGPKPEYIDHLRAIRGEPPLAVEGTPKVAGNGPSIALAEHPPPDDEDNT